MGVGGSWGHVTAGGGGFAGGEYGEVVVGGRKGKGKSQVLPLVMAMSGLI